MMYRDDRGRKYRVSRVTMFGEPLFHVVVQKQTAQGEHGWRLSNSPNLNWHNTKAGADDELAAWAARKGMEIVG